MSNQNGSNDIAEMLRLLRESVDNDRASSGDTVETEKEDTVAEPIDQEIENEAEDDSDPWYEDEVEESESDILIASEDEREDEDDNEEDPWFNADAIEESAPEDTVIEQEEEIDVFAYPEEEEDEEEIDVFAYPGEEEDEEAIEDLAEEAVEEEKVQDEDEIDVFAYPEEDELSEYESIAQELSEIEDAQEEKTEEETLDETDINLLKNMGYSPESVDSAFLSDEKEPSDTKHHLGDIINDNNGEEYVVKKQKEEIKVNYVEQKRNTIVRLAIAGCAALLLLVYEYLTFSGIDMPWLFNKHTFPVSHSLISLQLLLIAAVMSLNLISKGISDVFCLRTTPYSVGSVLILIDAVYTVVMAVVHPEDYMLFNFSGAFAAVLLIAYEYLLLVGEEKTFYSVTFDGKTKYAFAQDTENKYFGDQPTLRAYSTDFNKNFFEKMGRRASEYNYLGLLIPSVIAVASILFALVLIINGNMASAINTGMLVINLALPVGVVGAYSIPMLCGAISLNRESSALIGHSAAGKYVDTRFVTFDETDIFPSMKTTYIDLKPAGNRQISDILSKTSMLFSAIGGPLRRMVETSGETEENGRVEIVSIFDDGISAVVNSEEMLVGSARFLEFNNITVNASTDYRDADESNEILYVAISGKLAARYYIKYQADPDFVDAVNMLGAKGISVGIRTRNPSVNSKIIAKRCPEMKYKVYTIKSVSDDEKDLASHKASTDSGIISHGKAARLARPLVMAIMLKKYYKIDTYIRCASAAIGIVWIMTFAAMGRIGELSSLTAALYQLVWLVPCAIGALVVSAEKKKQ